MTQSNRDASAPSLATEPSGAIPAVLYVFGAPRSGTTVIGNALGSVAGVTHLGEVRRVWEAATSDRRRCGCGLPFARCPYWQRVMRDAGLSRDDARRLRRRVDSGWHRRRPIRPFGRDPWGGYAGTMEDVYRSASVTSEAALVVDTSKDPAGGSMLARMDGLESHFLLIVRDPRGVAFSRQRALMAQGTGSSRLRAHLLVQDMMRWRASVRAVRWARRSFGEGRARTIRYEDFAERPRETLGSILGSVGLGGVEPPMDDDRTLRLGTNHTCGGNRNRFDRGPIAIRPDERWRAGLSRGDRLLVMAMTWPLAKRFGYR